MWLQGGGWPEPTPEQEEPGGATQAIRSTMTAPSTPRQKTAIRPPDSSDSLICVRMRLACSPMSRNTVFSSRNWMVAQLMRSLIRDCPLWMKGDL